jgi:hypothetical protein
MSFTSRIEGRFDEPSNTGARVAIESAASPAFDVSHKPHVDDREDDRILHWCEVCGREELLTSEEGFEAGWDFPPRMGEFGVLSPRQCPNAACGVEETAWWAVAVEHISLSDLHPRHRATIDRISREVRPGGEGHSHRTR